MFTASEIHRHLETHGFAVESVVLDGTRTRAPGRTAELLLHGHRVQVVLQDSITREQASALGRLLASLEGRAGELARIRLEHPPLDPDLAPRVELHRLGRFLTDAEIQALLARLRSRFPDAMVELRQGLPGDLIDV